MLRTIVLVIVAIIVLLVVLFAWGVIEIGDEAIEAASPETEVEEGAVED